MSQKEQPILQKEQIRLLQHHSIIYMYNPKDNNLNWSWVKVNTEHMEYLLGKYDNCLNERDYSIIIKINKEIKYVSKDYNSIISYFRENSEEYTNTEYKLVELLYEFDNY
jgi:hypothetical protein